MDFLSKCTLSALSLAFLVVLSLSFAHGADELKPNYDFQKFKILNYGEPLTLQCLTTSTSPDLVVKWYKDGEPLKSSEGEKPNIVVKDNTVTIKRAMEPEVANYTCQLVNKNTNTNITEAVIEVVGKPYVRLPGTITVTEEEKLKLECTVIGSHRPDVRWVVGNETYMESRGRIKLSSSSDKVINNVLELEPAKMSDRGEIQCSGHNTATNFVKPNIASIYVRIKDKYAPLWPFLGICAEVIVLCTVIFIYEKKRNKSELEESDTDQSPEQKNTPDHAKDSVRHRK